MKHSALLLLSATVLSDCLIICGCQCPPEESAEALKYRKCFEAGRRSESKGDVRIAGDTYGWLIGHGSRYGEYGLAMLMLSREPDSREAVKLLVSCAKRPSHTSDLFPDSAMDSAFSVAAMTKLADIAVSEHDEQDVAAWLRSMAGDIVTTKVRAWAAEKKVDAEMAAIYGDIISAVESSRQSREYVKAFKWSNVGEMFMNGNASQGDGKMRLAESRYTVAKFVKVPDASCKYDFEVRLSENGTFEAADKVRSAIRRQLMKEFLAANPQDGAGDVRVSFLAWSQRDSTIEGSAAVMKVSAARLEYDAVTRRGKMSVRLDGRDVTSARKWALENIAELATGKNIALVVGKPPPSGASYTTGHERMTEDGLLEIEFTTE